MLALLCSGQGHQWRGMFERSLLFSGNDALFDVARELLRFDPRTALDSVPDGELFGNFTGQVLCALQALSVHDALRSFWPRTRCVAGYSVGEVAAWGLAGLATTESTLRLVAARARAMSAIAGEDQGMIALRGLPRHAVESLCRGREAAIAIINPGNSWVVAGRRCALTDIARLAPGAGAARVTPLAVAVASHTAMMAQAASSFGKVLADTQFAPAMPRGLRLLSGVDGAAVHEVKDGAAKLAAQIARPVDWAACLESCIEAGARVFLELGPGRALAQMTAAAYPWVLARSIEDFRSLDGVQAWVTASIDRRV